MRTIVVGAGHAGGRLVEALRNADRGAEIVLVGAEAHPPYERPPLSKAVLLGKASPDSVYLKPLSYYAEQDIALRLGARVEGIERGAGRLALAGGESLAYDRLVLATGARPRRLPVPGAEGNGVHYLRDIGDALVLGSRLVEGVRLVVVGAGLIGMEIASAALSRGARVTVLEAAERPMARVLTPELSAFFDGVYRRAGAEMRYGAALSGIEHRAGGAMVLRLADGDALAADLVVVGIGARPNDELAREAGLAVADGVMVDAFGVSSDPLIRAAGDVTRHFNPVLGRHVRLESWQNAQNQAIAVAKNLAGAEAPYAEWPWAWSDQFGHNLQLLGQPERWDETIWRGRPEDGRFTVFYRDAGKLVGVHAVDNPRDIGVARRIMQMGLVLSPTDLADPAVDLTKIVRAARSA